MAAAAEEEEGEDEDLEEMMIALNTKDANDSISSDLDPDAPAGESDGAVKAKPAAKKVVKKPTKGKAAAKK